jgi:hypothetical protein
VVIRARCGTGGKHARTTGDRAGRLRGPPQGVKRSKPDADSLIRCRPPDVTSPRAWLRPRPIPRPAALPLPFLDRNRGAAPELRLNIKLIHDSADSGQSQPQTAGG